MSTVDIADDLSDQFWSDATTVGTSAVRVVPTNLPTVKGVQIKADAANSAPIFIGRETVEIGQAMPLHPGEGLFIPIRDVRLVHAVSSAAGQILYWLVI